MKKIYSTLALCALFVGANAQQLTKTVVLTENAPKNSIWLNSANAKTATTSTLMPATMTGTACGTNTANITFYSIAQTQPTANFTVVAEGYLAGTNKTTYVLGPTYASALGTPTITDVMSIAAQKYNVTGNVNVTDILVGTGFVNGTASMTAKVFDENTSTKAPNTLLGTSTSFPFANITGYDALNFATPVAVTAGNFFAAIESPAIGGSNMDSLAILSTVMGCSSTDSLAWSFHVGTPATAAAQAGIGGWNSLMVDFGSNADFVIFPVVDIPTGLNSISKGNLTLFAAFPNPATNELNVNFGLKQSSNVEIEAFDVTGKSVYKTSYNNLEAGNHSAKLNTSNLSAGVYMYCVKTETGKMFSKFTITK